MKIDLSNSEWKLMNRLWQDAPMTITELTAALKEDTGWTKNIHPEYRVCKGRYSYTFRFHFA